MIKINSVNKMFGENFTAVDNLEFEVKKGEIVGFVGQNGAGKTTTIKMMTGILNPTSGNILVNEFDIEKDPINAKKSIGYIADNPDMFLYLTGLEYINFLADIYDISKEDRVSRIEELANRFEVADVIDTPMSDYSHGMRQKMMVIAALVHNPPVWILDEPMTGLDPKAAFELKKMMREHADSGKCVFFSTHVLEVVEKLCDRIVIIRKGKLVFCGTIEELTLVYPDKTLEDIFLDINESKGE